MEKPLTHSIQVDSREATRAYTELANFKVEVDERATTNKCAIYFSSNALYYPNHPSVIQRIIFDKDRYEWFKIRFNNCRKHIFVRDVRKQWYLSGIS